MAPKTTHAAPPSPNQANHSTRYSMMLAPLAIGIIYKAPISYCVSDGSQRESLNLPDQSELHSLV